MPIKVFENEFKVKRIGGRLETEYYEFRNRVLFLNDNYIPLFVLLGFTTKDKDKIFNALFTRYYQSAICNTYIEHTTEKIEAGKIQLASVLTSRMMNKIAEASPEEVERLRKREVHRSLVTKYRAIYKDFCKKYHPSKPYFDTQSLKALQEALSLSPYGIEINVDKFIELYEDFLQADKSNARKKHQKVADTINDFFGGSVEITEKEIEKYFVIDHGVVKPNPLSITIESYLRLGYSLKEETKKL